MVGEKVRDVILFRIYRGAILTVHCVSVSSRYHQALCLSHVSYRLSSVHRIREIPLEPTD